MPTTIYHYPSCSTCRKAIAWLKQKDIAYEPAHIVETPPSAALLKRALKSGIQLRALFNTSGESYRNGGFKERLPQMSEAEAIEALCADGKLIKRPVLAGKDFVLVGFDEAKWKQTLL
jgi:arsenate reductase